MCSCSWDSSVIGYLTASGRNVSLLSRMARPPTSEHVLNLVRDVWDMVVGLLLPHCVEGTGHGCDQLCGSTTGGASVPLQGVIACTARGGGRLLRPSCPTRSQASTSQAW